MGKRLLTLFCILLSAGVFGNSTDSLSFYQKFLAKEGANWKVRWDGSIITSLYGTGKTKSSSPLKGASGFLDDYHFMLGIEESASLRLMKTERTAAGAYFFYQQYFAGLPVVGGHIVLHLDKQNRLISANSGYKTLAGNLTFLNDASKPFQTVTTIFGKQSRVVNKGLWVFPAGKYPKTVWRIEVESASLTGGSWLVYVDASDPNIVLLSKSTSLSFEGEGNVWLENPVITPARQSQIFTNMDATKALSGKFVKVYNANSTNDVRLPLNLSDYTTAKQNDRKYNYEETDLKLTEAMAYFHITRVHDRWSSFGFGGLDAKAPVFVNTTLFDGGPGWDNAQYVRTSRFPKTGFYVFGSGNENENTGLDGEIYYHEYGHGVLDRIKPELLDSFESAYPASFHEAFGDISAAAISGNSKFADYGFRLKKTKQFRGRNMNNRKKFPKDVIWPEVHISEPHYTCLILTGAWWDLQRRIGRIEAQRILYNGLRMLSGTMNFFDVKESMLAADRSLNNGANGSAIEQSFALHGLGGNDPGQTGSFSVQNLMTAGLPPTSNYVLKSSFGKGELITVILEYSASNLVPGYWLVPVKFEVKGPGGVTPRSQFLITEVFSGPHQGLNGLYMAEIHTETSSPSGAYTIKVQTRLGGTTNLLPEKSVTFTLN